MNVDMPVVSVHRIPKLTFGSDSREWCHEWCQMCQTGRMYPEAEMSQHEQQCIFHPYERWELIIEPGAYLFPSPDPTSWAGPDHDWTGPGHEYILL